MYHEWMARFPSKCVALLAAGAALQAPRHSAALADEQIAEANAALIENAQHYPGNPNDLNDRDSFRWHSEMLCRLVSSFGAKGSVAPGRMNAETESQVMASLARFCARNARLDRAEVEKSRTWYIHESENHHAQGFTS